MRQLSATCALTFLVAIWSITLPAKADPAIAITNPPGGTTLHCVIPVQATITTSPSPPSSWANAHLKITNNLGSTTDIPMPSPQGGMINNTAFSYSWNTMAVTNGTYYLQAYFAYATSTGTGTAYSGLVTVTVQNGYILASSGNVARVDQPTNGATLTANGQPFTISSSHTVVWTRHDDCANYSAHYKFQLETTYPAGVQTIVTDDLNYQLPLQTGDCPWSHTLSKQFNTGGPTPAQYQVYAKTFGQASNLDSTLAQAASSGSGFSMTAP